MFALLLISCSGQTAGNKKTEIRFGTSGSGGIYFTYLDRLSKQMQDEIKFDLTTTSGSQANINLLEKGSIDAALVQNDLLEEHKNDSAEISFSAAAGLFAEAVQIITDKDSGINSVEDLRGMKVAVGEQESGAAKSAEKILAAYDMSFDDIKVKYMSFSKAADALSSGDIDAFFVTAGTPTPAVTKLAKAGSLKLISLDESAIDDFTASNTAYFKYTIPKGTYPDQEEDITTVGTKAVLVVSNDLDDETVKQLTAGAFKSNSGLDTDFAREDIAIDFHNGALEYYAEQQ